MSSKGNIQTYDTESFRGKFVEQNPVASSLFKNKFESFFCLRIEDIKSYAKFPIPPAKEDGHSVIFVKSGTYRAKIGFKEYFIKPNEISVIPAGQIFSLDSIDKNVKGFTCHFHPLFLVGKIGNKELMNHFRFLKIWDDSRIKLSKQKAGFITNLFERMQIEYAMNGIGNNELIQSYLLALLFELNYSLEAENNTLSSAALITRQFKELLLAHVKEKNRVAEYADLLNISPNHLNKSVKRISGKSPNKWIDETIVTEAKYLLFQTTLSINEIACEVGHLDQSYFTRMFKKYEGMTPLAFRKKIEKC